MTTSITEEGSVHLMWGLFNTQVRGLRARSGIQTYWYDARSLIAVSSEDVLR